MSLKESIYSPRLHLEDNQIYLERGIGIDSTQFINKNIKINKFNELNLFFGGVNAVSQNEAISDPRRGGCGLEC